MSAADHDVKPGDSQDEVCKCGHLHAEHYGKVATARCTICEGPARPVEEREPVGPYAPTRGPDDYERGVADGRTMTGAVEFEAGYRQGWRERHSYGAPRYKGLPTLTNRPQGGTELGDYLVEQFGVVGTRLDGLVDVVLRQEQRLTERFGRIDTALGSLTDLFVDSRDEIERIKKATADQSDGGEALVTKGFADASYDLGKNHGMRDLEIRVEEAFERGRQQGDADRAQRGVSEYERGKADGRASMMTGAAPEGSVRHLMKDQYDRGRKIGAAEREAELLDQGWTPPGAIVLRMDPELSDARLWIKAVAIAGSQRDRRQLNPERVRADAVWFYGELKTGPEPASYLVDQEREQTRVTEHEAAADLPAKEIPGAEADYPF